jgi:2,3,4,5-tetrahydropyridine-2,6-dicarboxylate N-succinyltransferase
MALGGGGRGNGWNGRQDRRIGVRGLIRERRVKLQSQIETIYNNATLERDESVLEALANFRQGLNRGEIRAAEWNGKAWNANAWVKKGLALCARFGRLTSAPSGPAIDLDTLPLRRFTEDDRIRVTDSTCFVREGACISPGCTLMPHIVIQAGAYVGPNTIVDVGAGIGVCAQIGAGVHINAGAQIHGQIQPFDALPVIVGEGVSIGANCVIGAGVVIGPGAMIFPGMALSRQTRLYDPIRKQRAIPTRSDPLTIPPHAIVIPGTRLIAPDKFMDLSIGIQVGVIAGYTNEAELPAMLLDRLLEN